MVREAEQFQRELLSNDSQTSDSQVSAVVLEDETRAALLESNQTNDTSVSYVELLFGLDPSPSPLATVTGPSSRRSVEEIRNSEPIQGVFQPEPLEEATIQNDTLVNSNSEEMDVNQVASALIVSGSVESSDGFPASISQSLSVATSSVSLDSILNPAVTQTDLISRRLSEFSLQSSSQISTSPTISRASSSNSGIECCGKKFERICLAINGFVSF